MINNTFIQRYKLTTLGLALAFLLPAVSKLFDIEPFEHLVHLLKTAEEIKLDEFFLGSIIFLCFFVADLLRRQKREKINREKVRIYTAMLSSAHHILNNFLNQMLLFKITAENTPGFDQHILSLFDTVMDEADQQIKKLGDITEIDAETIKDSVKPQ